MFLLISGQTACRGKRASISIHLMFLLIQRLPERAYRQRYFNTSHVSINLIRAAHGLRRFPDFNTSHVSINL